MSTWGESSSEQRRRLECLYSVNCVGPIDANEVCLVALGNYLRWKELRVGLCGAWDMEECGRRGIPGAYVLTQRSQNLDSFVSLCVVAVD